jgi:hypothetical protein
MRMDIKNILYVTSCNNYYKYCTIEKDPHVFLDSVLLKVSINMSVIQEHTQSQSHEIIFRRGRLRCELVAGDHAATFPLQRLAGGDRRLRGLRSFSKNMYNRMSPL